MRKLLFIVLTLVAVISSCNSTTSKCDAENTTCDTTQCDTTSTN